MPWVYMVYKGKELSTSVSCICLKTWVMALFLPRHLPRIPTVPSFVTVITGLILASSPMAAADLESRPPLQRYSSVSSPAKSVTLDFNSSTLATISSAGIFSFASEHA